MGIWRERASEPAKLCEETNLPDFCYRRMSNSSSSNGVTFDGGVYSPFLTGRLPAWAGVRQNVTGSTVDGKPVDPSNAASMRYATVETPITTSGSSSSLVAAATSAVLSAARALAMEPEMYRTMPVQNTASAYESYRREIAELVAQLATVSQQLQLVSSRVEQLTRQ